VTPKSVDAFRTISEVAEELDVPQHVLRFWEGKFAQVKPLKRGGGRRYYRPDDVDLLRGIRRLLHVEGYTIKGVQKVLRDQGARMVLDLGRGAISRIDSNGADLIGEEDDDAAGFDVPGQAPVPVPVPVYSAPAFRPLTEDARNHLFNALEILDTALSALDMMIPPKV